MSKAAPGDLVTVSLKDGKEYEGILLPRPKILGEQTVVLKLKSGYNVGIAHDKIKKIAVVEKHAPKKVKDKKVAHDKNLKHVTVLHTGGTIASKVDYRTGGVVPTQTAQEFLDQYPELQQIANVTSKLLFQMFSEDFEAEHWKKMAQAIEKEYKNGAVGVIITQGTDTIHYTSAILSFMLQNCPIPVLVVGSQRSPDRGSSDAYRNMKHAVQFLIETDFAGVGVCMHGSTHDDYSLIHLGVQARKMHTSRRDAFRSIHTPPLAKVTDEGIDYLLNDYKKKEDVSGKFHILGKFEKKVGIMKLRPNMNADEFLFYLDKGYKGLIIEGTGFGNAPINHVDDLTKKHPQVLEALRKMSKKMVIVMCSQCIYGLVDMRVYSTGRYLMDAGVIGGADMMPEVAYVKLGWLLGNFTEKQAREKILENLAGEVVNRTHVDTFLK